MKETREIFAGQLVKYEAEITSKEKELSSLKAMVKVLKKSIESIDHISGKGEQNDRED